MDNRKVIYKLGIVLGLASLLGGCKPATFEPDNDNVISKPYVLFVGDTMGTIYKTNDGFQYEVVLGSDNYPASAIVGSGNNLLFIKRNVHFIENLGQSYNSNPTFLANGLLTDYGSSIIINVPKFKNRIYMGGGGNKGYYYNDSNGRPGRNYTSWIPEIQLQLPNDNIFTSFTLLDNGKLIGYDDVHKRIFTLTDMNGQWQQVLGSSLPSAGKFILSHMGNIILAADIGGTNGVYYSSNDGASWQQYSGLPADTKILSICGSFGQTALVGTQNRGIYRVTLGTTAFTSANIGLHANAVVSSMVEKYNQYKNDRTVKYVYAATDRGVYRTQDNGQNWVKVFDGPDGRGSYNILY